MQETPIVVRLSFRNRSRAAAPQNVRWIREGVRAYFTGTVLSFLVFLSLNAALVASLVEYTPMGVAAGALITAGSDFVAALVFFSLARMKFRRVRIRKNGRYEDDAASDREQG